MSQATPHGAPGTAQAVQPEAVVARLRSHARVLVLPCLVLVADVAALGYFGGTFEEAWLNWVVVGAAVLVAVLGFLVPLIAWLDRKSVVEGKSVDVGRGRRSKTKKGAEV